MYTILASHGPMAQGTKETAEMIAGPQENLYAFGIFPGEDPEVLSEKIENVVKEAIDKGEDIFIFTDLVSGTPFNVTIPLMMKYPSIYHVTGLNVTMLVSFLSQKSFMSAQELYDDIRDCKDDFIMLMNDVIASLGDEDDDEDEEDDE